MNSRYISFFIFLLSSSIAFGQNNVGIGTTTPQAKLDVNGTFKLQNGVIVNGISADSTFSPGSDSLLPTQLAVKRYLQKGAFAPVVGNVDSFLTVIGLATSPDPIVGVDAQDSFVYVTKAGFPSKITIYSVSDPYNIVERGSTSMYINNAKDIAVKGNYAYVANYYNTWELSIWDISNPDTILPVSQVSTGLGGKGLDVEVQGNFVYLLGFNSSSFRIYDVTDPYNIIPRGVSDYTGISQPTSLKISGNVAYLTSAYNSRLYLFDISNPDNVITLGYTDTNIYYPQSVDVSGNYAYVANVNRLSIFDISDPTNIVAKGYIEEQLSFSQYVRVKDNLAYVGSEGNNRIVVFDISDPQNPHYVTSIQNFSDNPNYNTHFQLGMNNILYAPSVTLNGLASLKWMQISDDRSLVLHGDGQMNFSPNNWQKDESSNLFTQGIENVGIGTYNPTAKLHLSGNMKIDYNNTLEFGAGYPNKQVDAGKIGYQAFSSDALDIVGAGTPNNRKLRFFCEGGAQFDGSVVVPNGWLAIGRDVPAAPLHVNGNVKIDGTNMLEFGAGIPGKQQDAGKIGYQTFSGNALDIIGAGTPFNRRVRFFAEKGTLFDGKISVTDSLIVNGHTRLSGKMKIDSTNTLEFGAGIAGKQIDAGKIGYKTFSGNALDIIGAGAPNQRRIQLFAEAGTTVQGKLIVTDSISGTNAKFSGKVGIGTSTPTATLHVAGNQKIDGTNSLEFGAGIPGKQADAGKIGYTLYSNALDIIGAGPSFQRRIKLWAESGVSVEGKLIATDSIIGNNGKLSGNGLIGNNLIVNGNLGVGTNNPGYKLDVNGRLRLRYNGDIAGIYFNNSTNALGGFVGMVNDSYMGIYGQSGAGWSLVTNTTNGNVGIGNTNPNYKLDVNGRMRLRYNGETSGLYFNTSANTEEGFIGMYNDSYLGFYGASGDIWNLVMNTTNGNVGIGLTNPSAPLHLNGNEKINSDYSVEFGAGVSGKQQDAGKIGYQTFTTGALDIVGAGPTSGTRKVKIWDNLIVDKIETEAWTDLSGYLDNFWANYGSGYATAACYKDQFGVVHLRGTIKDGYTNPGTVILTLPAGYRPTNGRLVFATVNGLAAFGRVDVTTSGDVLFYGSSSALLSLDQISFRTY